MTRSPNAIADLSIVVCKRCGYDTNSANALQCEICGFSLQDKKLSAKLAMLHYGALGALTVLLLGAGGYFFWQQKVIPPAAIPHLKQSHPVGQSSDIKFYSSMQEVPNVPQGLFNYGGAFLFSALASNGINDSMTQIHPNFRLRYTEPLNQKPGSGTGIEMLTKKQLSFAQSGRPLKAEEYAKAKQQGFALEAVPVAIDGVAFFSHPDLKLPGLSLDQVQGIFTGTLTNWREVGGPDLAIVPVSLDLKTTSTLQVLLEGLKDATLSPNAKIVRDYTAAIRTVAATPGAISYASAPSVKAQKSIHLLSLAPTNSQQYVPVLIRNQQINAGAFRNGSYPFTRRLFAVIRRDGTFEEKAGVAYTNLLLTPEGQAIIEKAGFVAIR
jgi:phosphate transport system substrate-binding protein